MKHLTIASLLALLLGSAGVCWAADFQKGYEAWMEGDIVTGLRELIPSAEQGDIDAQSFLGLMYSLGQGVPQDSRTAVKWYTLAAEQGNVSAQFELGLMYGTGLGVIQDDVYSHMWWNIAASSGDETAAGMRDRVAEIMTTAQIAEAQKLARECVRKEYKGC